MKPFPGSIKFYPEKLKDVQAIDMQPMVSSVLFSSIASLTGPAGSANYAAANASVDSLASLQQASGAFTHAETFTKVFRCGTSFPDSRQYQSQASSYGRCRSFARLDALT